MKKVFISLLVSAVLAACNNSGKENADNKTDSMSHDMHAGDATAEMPPLPILPSKAKVFFVNLKDGQTVTSPVKVEMGVLALRVDTANGKLITGSGHHHILIDIDSVARGTVIPKDSVHLHFGNAQTSAEVPLTPGKHTLTLQFADALHRSYGGQYSARVTIYVKK
jgi:hypothetical protein